MTARERVESPRATMLAAYEKWLKAADHGYGDRDHTYAHMQRVDARIRRLKERYEQTVTEYLNSEKLLTS